MSHADSPLTRAQTAHIRDLIRDKHVREADGAFVIEGAKAVRDLLAHHPSLVRSVVTTPGYREREQPRDRRLRAAAACPSYTCPERVFAGVSDLDTTQGILAIAIRPEWNEAEVLDRPTLFGIYAEGIQDPLNVGTIIRTAAALGVSALWLTPDSADRYHPKVVRATSGGLLCLPVFVTGSVSPLVRRGCCLFAAEVGGPDAVELDKIEHVPPRVILAVGSEGQGLSEETKTLAIRRVTIPLSRRMESLNVASTVAIAAHVLQRLPKQSL
ncbi:MAG: RNA methyltransferase [Nitrospira sp.]|nr:RNA methyltransferase [Nitrospira sp.]